MGRDERLEMLSDKVRRGEGVKFDEALEVIYYQKSLRGIKKKTLLQTILDWIKR
jgi:hypothetical protein